MSKLLGFIRESKAELKKVTWPTRKQVVHSTIAIVVLTCIVGVFLGVVDLALSAAVSGILG